MFSCVAAAYLVCEFESLAKVVEVLLDLGLHQVKLDQGGSVLDRLVNHLDGARVLADPIQVLGEHHVVPEEAARCFLLVWAIQEGLVLFQSHQVRFQDLINNFDLGLVGVQRLDFVEHGWNSLPEVPLDEGGELLLEHLILDYRELIGLQALALRVFLCEVLIESSQLLLVLRIHLAGFSQILPVLLAVRTQIQELPVGSIAIEGN